MSIDKNLLDQISSRLVNAYHPAVIYLFGSHAWGSPNKDSDVDLLVVVNDNALPEEKKGLKGQYALADLIVPTDLLITTFSKFQERAEHPSALYHKIKNDAIKIYDAGARMDD
jgi:uncharacterized protein